MTKTARSVIARKVSRHAECDVCEPDDICAICLNEAYAILTALRDAGFAVVPVEPTEKMVLTGMAASERQSVTWIYRSMVQASQEQSE